MSFVTRKPDESIYEVYQWFPGNGAIGVLWDGNCSCECIPSVYISFGITCAPHVHTSHGNQVVFLEPGDWIFPEPDGIHYYPVKPDIFNARYDILEDTGK